MVKLHRLFVLTACLIGAVSPALATDFGDIVVKVDPGPPGNRGHGYVEYRVVVTNRASQTAHQVRLTIPANSYSGSGLEDVARTVTVQPSSTAVVSLLVPVLPVYGNGLGVSIDGRQQSEAVQVNIVQYGQVLPCVLISEGANKHNFQAQASNNMKDKSGNAEFSPLPSTAPVTEWSANWLAYSSFDSVVVTGDDMRTMPNEVSSALCRYVECGGTLLVLGKWDVPQHWRPVRNAPTAPVYSALPSYHAGFGFCIESGDLSPKDFIAAQWLYIKRAWDQSLDPWRESSRSYDQLAANRVFPVVEKLTVPVRGLFLLMLLFVVVIGPLNLFVLSRKKKKLWLLWTVPAISLVTCIAVSAYAILSEGWSGKARTAGLTILDEESHQATTIGWTAFYSPLTPGEGLRYGYETELTPLSGFDYRYGERSMGLRTVDWTQDQHLARGWVAARVPAHLMVRRSEVRRERITLNRGQDGSLSAVNGLGVSVRELWLADRDGRIYKANDVQAGASAVLSLQQGMRAVGDGYELRKAFDDDWFALAKWMEKPNSLLMPGCYIAALDSSPFIEEGLRGVGSRTSQSVVYGIMKRE